MSNRIPTASRSEVTDRTGYVSVAETRQKPCPGRARSNLGDRRSSQLWPISGEARGTPASSSRWPSTSRMAAIHSQPASRFVACKCRVGVTAGGCIGEMRTFACCARPAVPSRIGERQDRHWARQLLRHKEWDEFQTHARNSVESLNAQVLQNTIRISNGIPGRAITTPHTITVLH